MASFTAPCLIFSTISLKERGKDKPFGYFHNSRFVFFESVLIAGQKVFDMRHMREDSNFAPRPDLPPDLPTDEIKKKPFLFTWRQVVIFIILFILMLAGITIVESVVKTQRLRMQKQRVAEAVCIANDLNGADAELDNCIEVYLAFSEAFESGESPGGVAARISEDISAEEVRKVAKVWLAVQLKE